MLRIFIFLFCPSYLLAQAPGSLDPSFGNNGIFTYSIGTSNDQGTDIAQLTDGKIIVVGHSYTDASTLDDFFVQRLTSDGSIDPDFGTNGKVLVDFLNGEDKAQAVAIQSDGKILVAGYTLGSSGFNFAIARLLPDGTLDDGFGTNGKVIANFGSTDFCLAIRLLSDGKILLAGRAYNGITSDFALARLQPNGTLDNSFGSSGMVMFDLYGEQESINAITLQSDGKIVAVGETYNGNIGAFVVARFMPNGSPDISFGEGGKVKTIIGVESDAAYDVAIQSDGKIVVMGQSNSSTISDLAVVRYLPNGELDIAFSNDGILIDNVSMFGDYAYAGVLQTDGKILLAGSSVDQEEDIALFRYLSDGQGDTLFGNNGQVIIDAGTQTQDRVLAMSVRDGKILVAGQTGNFGANKLMLARFEQGPLLSRSSSLAIPIGLHVFPNPAQDHTTISFNLLDANELFLNLYNEQGQKVKSWNTGVFPAGFHQIDLHFVSLPIGIYRLQVSGKSDFNMGFSIFIGK
jgi:uncharacterized delta-60 repeat protein